MSDEKKENSKFQQIKRKLLKESAVSGLVIVVLGAITYYLGTLSDDFANKNNALQSEATNAASEMTALQDKYNKVQQNTALYQEAMHRSAHDGLSINKQLIRDKFNVFKDQYYLSNLKLSMGAIEDLSDALYKRKTLGMIRSKITVDFSSLNDEHVYNLITTMQQELSGAPKITKLTLTRNDNGITDDILRIISQTGSYNLIKGELEFMWLGIKPIEPTSSDANADPKLKH